MPKTVEHIEKNKLADRIEVFNRSSQLLYQNELHGENWKEPPKAAQIVEAERHREPTGLEKQQFHIDWDRINKLMEKRQATLREFDQVRKVYERFNRQLDDGGTND